MRNAAWLARGREVRVLAPEDRCLTTREKLHDASERTELIPAAPSALRATEIGHEQDTLIVLSYPLQPPFNLEQLTEGEATVIILAAMGLPNATIAAVRGVAERTVANQLGSAYRKLGGISRSGLCRALIVPRSPEVGAVGEDP